MTIFSKINEKWSRNPPKILPKWSPDACQKYTSKSNTKNITKCCKKCRKWYHLGGGGPTNHPLAYLFALGALLGPKWPQAPPKEPPTPPKPWFQLDCWQKVLKMEPRRSQNPSEMVKKWVKFAGWFSNLVFGGSGASKMLTKYWPEWSIIAAATILGAFRRSPGAVKCRKT